MAEAACVCEDPRSGRTWRAWRWGREATAAAQIPIPLTSCASVSFSGKRMQTLSTPKGAQEEARPLHLVPALSGARSRKSPRPDSGRAGNWVTCTSQATVKNRPLLSEGHANPAALPRCFHTGLLHRRRPYTAAPCESCRPPHAETEQPPCPQSSVLGRTGSQDGLPALPRRGALGLRHLTTSQPACTPSVTLEDAAVSSSWTPAATSPPRLPVLSPRCGHSPRIPETNNSAPAVPERPREAAGGGGFGGTEGRALLRASSERNTVPRGRAAGSHRNAGRAGSRPNRRPPSAMQGRVHRPHWALAGVRGGRGRLRGRQQRQQQNKARRRHRTGLRL